MKHRTLIIISTSILTWFCYCNEKQTKTIDDANINYKLNLSNHNKGVSINNDYYKNFKANDSSDFNIQFRAENGRVYVDLDLSKSLPFRKQVDELKKVILEASKEFSLDSLKSISIEYNNCSDLIVDICSIPEIQDSIMSCYEKKRMILNSSELSKHVLKSKYIQLLLKCFGSYDLKIKYVSIEKCNTWELERLKNLSIKPKNDTMKVMLCNSLYIRLKKN